MYGLKEFFTSVFGLSETAIPSSEIICRETDTESTFYTNKMQDTLAAYTFTLVRNGRLQLLYNGQQITLKPGDLYIYSPGFQVTIVSGSDNYRGVCLMADENLTLETPTIRNIIRAAYLPLAEWGKPVVHISGNNLHRILRRMQEIRTYQQTPHHFKSEILRTLYTAFLLDLRDIQEQNVDTKHYSERTTDLFVNFMRLLPKHFTEHHHIAFYASELCITTTHLSRVVRQMTGHTVVDYINRMLTMESVWLLQTTDLSLAAIAERLHFANQSCFSKFFLRMKGISPKKYRTQHTFSA